MNGKMDVCHTAGGALRVATWPRWAGALALVFASAAAAQEADLLKPGEPIAGATAAEWSMRWWQWAFSFERARSPISDRTGALCASRQLGDVWFLAGTYGSGRTERLCTVPSGKWLFFPLVNHLAFRGDESKESCQSLAARAAALATPSALVLDVDGRRYTGLELHRVASPCFSLVPGQPPDAVSNGYYVALRPLPPGRHLINFGGVLSGNIQAVTYTLDVE